MSRLAVINPNLSSGFTKKIGAQARKIVGGTTQVLALNPAFGPDSIEGYYDEAFASVGLLSVIRELESRPEQQGDPIGGYIVACFDDTGVDAPYFLTNCSSGRTETAMGVTMAKRDDTTAAMRRAASHNPSTGA